MIISPFVADLYILTDAITMTASIEKAVLQPAIEEFEKAPLDVLPEQLRRSKLVANRVTT